MQLLVTRRARGGDARSTAVGRLPAMTTLFMAALVIVAGACRFPRDPAGTLERVEGATLRVAFGHRPPWAVWSGIEPSGVEADLVRGIAHELRARIEWRRGTDEELLKALRAGDVDLVAAGLESDSPWAGTVSFTRPFDGRHVLAVRAGENAWLLRLDRYLARADRRS